MYLRIYMFSIYTCSFLDLAQQFTVWLLPLLASLKVICSCRVSVSSFLQTSPSPVPLPYNFGDKTQEVEVPSHSPWPALWRVETCQAHFPAWAFKISSRGRPVPSWAIQALCKGFIGFPHTPRNIGLSLSLFLSSSFLYTLFFERLTNSRTEAFCHSTSLHPPWICAWPSSPGKLGWYSRAP